MPVPSGSEAHIEDSADAVTATLLAAFARWRPCHTPRAGHGPPLALCRHRTRTLTQGHWWDATACVGMCGDWLNGGQGGRCVAQRPIAGAASAAGPLNQKGPAMRMRKQDLPQKTLPALRTARSLAQKWEKVWDEVKYCLTAAAANAKRTGNAAGGHRMSTVLFWFRNDLRLHRPTRAARSAHQRCYPPAARRVPSAPDERTPWGFCPCGRTPPSPSPPQRCVGCKGR